MPVFLRRKSKSKAALAVIALGTLFSLTHAQDRTVMVPLVLDGRSPVQIQWRISTDDPGADWNQTSFDDASWLTAYGGFGSGTVLASHINTDWSSPDIWMRRSFDVADANLESLVLSIHHDDGVEVYLNGDLVFTETGFSNDYRETYLGDQFTALIKAGANELAVHCHNNDGPGYIDVGLSGTRSMQATSIIADARTFPEEWKLVNTDPGTDWYQPAFADADWATGLAGFGSTEYSAYVGTEWISSDIWLRKTVTLARTYDDYLLAYQHDDDVEIYVNGILMVQETGFTTEYKDQILSAVKDAMVIGANTIAVHCRNNAGAGGQFIDVSLVGLVKPVPVHDRSGLSGRHAAAFPRVLFVGGAGRDSELDLSRFPASTVASLAIYGLDGSLRATLLPEGRKTMAVPSTLGTGSFRYLWRSPTGSGQGLLMRLP